MTRTEGGSPASNPTPKAGETHLQRGANGRWALTDTGGAWIEADAAVFVEVDP